ncbi:hypothetical protein JT358_10600 [Micrococcales bacterium 31B]|nr:hypothetical protein [Micrococcales bacterium 31B]
MKPWHYVVLAILLVIAIVIAVVVALAIKGGRVVWRRFPPAPTSKSPEVGKYG